MGGNNLVAAIFLSPLLTPFFQVIAPLLAKFYHGPSFVPLSAAKDPGCELGALNSPIISAAFGPGSFVALRRTRHDWMTNQWLVMEERKSGQIRGWRFVYSGGSCRCGCLAGLYPGTLFRAVTMYSGTAFRGTWPEKSMHKKRSYAFSLRNSFIIKSGKRDSNSRPPAWEASALPTELFPQGRFPANLLGF